MTIKQLDASKGLIRPWIHKQTTQLAVYELGSSGKDDETQNPIYREFVRTHSPDDHNEDDIDSILVESSIYPEDSSEDGPLRGYPYGLIYSVSFGLYPAEPDTDLTLRLKEAVTEAVVRTRIAAANFVFSCGGAKARAYYIQRQREAIGVAEEGIT